jgi:hypothetical protein
VPSTFWQVLDFHDLNLEERKELGRGVEHWLQWLVNVSVKSSNGSSGNIFKFKSSSGSPEKGLLVKTLYNTAWSNLDYEIVSLL